jgi:ESCRT-II complex subunit VPS22
MCTAIGVDPLVGSTKDKNTGKSSRGMLGWGVLGVGEFWISVATRVVALCRRSRGSNGGFISVSEVARILAEEDKRARVKDSVEISEYVPYVTVIDDRDDIVRSISALAPLGPGVSVVTLPSGARYIRSIPKELNPDQAVVLEVAGLTGGCVSVGLLRVNLQWEEERAKSVLEELVAEGMVWVDDAGMEREYWIPRGITEL